MLERFIPMARGNSLKAKGVRSTFWTTFGFGLQIFLRLGSNLILTRLLVPEMFGLIALAMVIIQGLSFLSDVGTHHSVMRSTRGDEPAFLRTAWSVQVVRNLCIAGATVLIAYPASLLYEQPLLFPVLAALSLGFVIGGFSSISMATASREMAIGRRIMVQLGSQVVTIVVMVALAWYFRSIWALVIGSIAGSTAHLILSFKILKPFEHRFEFEPESLRELINYGRWAIFSSVFMFFGGQGITAVQAALVPIATIGLLSISTQLIRALEDLVQRLLTNVGFPALTKTLRDNPKDLRRMLTKLRLTLVLASLALFLVLSAVAQPLIDFLYDDRYLEAGTFLMIQALNGAIRAMYMPYQNVVLAQGDSRTNAGVMLANAVFGILGTLAGFYLFGIYGMLMGLGAAALVTFGISAWIAVKRGFADLRFDALTLAVVLAAYGAVLVLRLPVMGPAL